MQKGRKELSLFGVCHSLCTPLWYIEKGSRQGILFWEHGIEDPWEIPLVQKSEMQQRFLCLGSLLHSGSHERLITSTISSATHGTEFSMCAYYSCRHSWGGRIGQMITRSWSWTWGKKYIFLEGSKWLIVTFRKQYTSEWKLIWHKYNGDEPWKSRIKRWSQWWRVNKKRLPKEGKF